MHVYGKSVELISNKGNMLLVSFYFKSPDVEK